MFSSYALCQFAEIFWKSEMDTVLVPPIWLILKFSSLSLSISSLSLIRSWSEDDLSCSCCLRDKFFSFSSNNYSLSSIFDYFKIEVSAKFGDGEVWTDKGGLESLTKTSISCTISLSLLTVKSFPLRSLLVGSNLFKTKEMHLPISFILSAIALSVLSSYSWISWLWLSLDSSALILFPEKVAISGWW